MSVHDGKDTAGNTDTTIDDTIAVTINLTNVNEAPVIVGAVRGAESRENRPATEPNGYFRASDPDASTTLTWTLEGDDESFFRIMKTSDTEAELRFRSSPNFEMPSDVGSDNFYNVTVRVEDDGSPTMSDTWDYRIAVTNVNEAPVIESGPATMSVPENSTAVGAYTASDVDADTTLTWSVESAADGSFFQIDENSGALSFINAPNFEDKQDAGADNVYNVTVKVTDNGSPSPSPRMSATRDVAVTVTNVNEAPVIPDPMLFLDYDENSPRSTQIDSYRASNVDASTTFAWSLEGNDKDEFTITKNPQGWGVLTFVSQRNYEMPTDTGGDNVYNVTVKATDNGSPAMSATEDVTVTVIDLNERPVISGDTPQFFAEIEFDLSDADLAPGDYVIGAYSAYDDDGDNVNWSLGSSQDDGHFAITENAAGEGVLSFAIRPDFENPEDTGSNNAFLVTIRANDGQGESTSVGTLTVSVRVTNVDETPEITSTDPTHATPSFAEIAYDAMTADLTVADYDARDEETEAITWSLGGADTSDFTINSTSGVLSFAPRPDFEASTDSSPHDNVYDIIVKATDATPTANTREYPVAVTVTDVDETPEIDGPNDNPNFRETPYDALETPNVATFTARDEEDQNITWSLGGEDGEDFTITKDADTGAGVVAFSDQPNFEMPADEDSRNTYEFTVEAHDGTNTGTWEYAVTVTDVNETPELTGTPETMIPLDEHDANEIYTTPGVASYTARDEEGAVEWSLTGPDSGDFAIDSGGVVTFANAPSFEAPTDFEGDNIYMFTVVATDVGSGSSRLSTSVEVTVTVMDIEEDGIITVENLIPQLGTDCDSANLSDPGDGCVVFRLTDP